MVCVLSDCFLYRLYVRYLTRAHYLRLLAHICMYSPHQTSINYLNSGLHTIQAIFDCQQTSRSFQGYPINVTKEGQKKVGEV